MRPSRLIASLALAGCAALPSAQPARAQETRYTRPVEVPRPGWVRVALDADVLRKAEGAGGSPRLFGPEGEDVPFRRVPAEAAGARVPAVRAGVGPGPRGGWQVLVTLGDQPAHHDRLVLGLAAPPPAGTLRLDGSSDGETWRLLVVGSLVPAAGAGPADGAVVAGLPYPASDVRLLRLSGWPAGGGPPEIRGAAVESVPARSFHLALPRPDCRSSDPPSAASARTVCRLPVGGSGRYLRRLDFVVGGEGPIGYRLFEAEEGRWEPVGEGVWGPVAGEAPRCLPLELAISGPAESLRLELYSTAGEAPALEDYGADFTGEALLFRARRAGTHTLAYGSGVVQVSPGAAPRPPPDAEVMRLEAGAAEASAASGAPPSLPDSGVAAPAIHFAGTWPVTADEKPEPGELYRLVLPPPVYGVARPDLGDLRLIAADVQVPYARWRPAEPVPAAQLRTAAPVPAETAGHSRLDLVLPIPGLPLSSLVLSAPAGRFGRRVRALYQNGAEGAASAAPQAASPWLEWQCTARAPLPCRITLALEGGPATRVIVEIDDRGAPPLGQVDLEVWRRRDLLLFPWPSGERALALGAGAEDLEAPDEDLASRLDELLARPWRDAQVVLDPTEGADGSGRLGSWAVAMALVLAAALLLFLLHRVLREQEER